MKFTDLNTYANQIMDRGLIELIPDIKFSLDFNDWFVVQTKETYSLATEDEANDLINEIRQQIGFKACDKKFKAGKVNKEGEEIRPDAWIVKATLTF